MVLIVYRNPPISGRVLTLGKYSLVYCQQERVSSRHQELLKQDRAKEDIEPHDIMYIVVNNRFAAILKFWDGMHRLSQNCQRGRHSPIE